MSYYQTSTQYHDDLDRFEARTRAEQAERMYNKLAEVENTYGPNWEQDADDLHYVLEHGNEMIETGELSQWVGVQSVGKVSNHDLLVQSGAVNADGSLKPYIATGHKSVPMTPDELGMGIWE